jgi:hypothetical protein
MGVVGRVTVDVERDEAQTVLSLTNPWVTNRQGSVRYVRAPRPAPPN